MARLTPEGVESSIREMWDAIAAIPSDPDFDEVHSEASAIERRLRARLAAQDRLDAAAPALLAAAQRLITDQGRCGANPLNPCWDARPTDVVGQHWGGPGIPACAYCTARAAIALAGEQP